MYKLLLTLQLAQGGLAVKIENRGTTLAQLEQNQVSLNIEGEVNVAGFQASAAGTSATGSSSAQSDG